MGRSWGHAVRWLTAAEIDRYDRWGERCAVSRKCEGAAVCLTAYDYVTGRAGRVSQSSRRACGDHAAAFAAKNGIEIAPAPTTEPKRERGIIAAAVSALDTMPEYVVLDRRAGGPWTATKYGGGSIISGTCWLDLLPKDASLEEALPAAEAALARQHRLVLTEPWAVDGQRARAGVASAEATEPWATAPWTLTVAEVHPTYGRPEWRVAAALDPRFRVETWALGNTGMSLDRAIRTVPDVMGDSRWEIGEWTRVDQTATTTAYRKATARA